MSYCCEKNGFMPLKLDQKLSFTYLAKEREEELSDLPPRS